MTMQKRSRRSFLRAAGLATGGVLLTGCDRLLDSKTSRTLWKTGELLTMYTQRALMTERTLAREFPRSMISKVFPSTGGETLVALDAYQRLLDVRFATWRLRVGGMVERPLELSLNQLKDLPGRTQITQHQCDEGWSAIGEWTGVPVGNLLQMARISPKAKYVVFYCMDKYEGVSVPFYESLDMFDAFHPQTLLAYGMNGKDLPAIHGAPLRLRAELHIGFKNAKHVERVDVVESVKDIGRGGGSFVADWGGYQWFAGM